jgi:hypothetical protein
MKRNLCFFCLALCLCLIIACDGDYSSPPPPPPEGSNSESSLIGVVVHGLGSPGYIKNTNSFPVIIRAVTYNYGEWKGELYDSSPLWTIELKPDEKKELFIPWDMRFFIYFSSTDTIERGIIQPVQNK